MTLVSKTLEDKILEKLGRGESLEVVKGIRIYSVLSERGEIVPLLKISNYAKNEINKYKSSWNK